MTAPSELVSPARRWIRSQEPSLRSRSRGGLRGDFSVSVGSRTIELNEWRLKNAATPVKLLALAPGHRLHREQVMETLWPHPAKGVASNSLRRTLYAARWVLNPAYGSVYLASEEGWLIRGLVRAYQDGVWKLGFSEVAGPSAPVGAAVLPPLPHAS